VLESKPPIDVFAGLEQLAAGTEHVSGLPSSEELEAWFTEHDNIESEIERFDKGDMIRLKEFAKGAAIRYKYLLISSEFPIPLF
jgi:hypothetical protein